MSSKLKLKNVISTQNSIDELTFWICSRAYIYANALVYSLKKKKRGSQSISIQRMSMRAYTLLPIFNSCNYTLTHCRAKATAEGFGTREKKRGGREGKEEEKCKTKDDRRRSSEDNNGWQTRFIKRIRGGITTATWAKTNNDRIDEHTLRADRGCSSSCRPRHKSSRNIYIYI